MTVNEAAAALTGADGILILTHQRPDGDTIGSAAALCRALRAMGKTAALYPNAEITETYKPFAAEYLAEKGFLSDYTVAVDLAEPKLFPLGFNGCVDLCIDHHPTNTHYAKSTCLRPEKASCGEIICELLEAMGCELDRECADLLYMAVSTDTGCFCYANTKAQTLRTAARLIDAGADNAGLNKLFFRTFSAARLMLEGMIFTGLRRFRDGTVNFAVVTLDMMRKAGASEDDCDDLASLAGRIEGSRVSVTVRELREGHCKVSVRTDGVVDASRVCSMFDGGGHVMAAGCELDCGPDETVRRILAAIEDNWK